MQMHNGKMHIRKHYIHDLLYLHYFHYKYMDHFDISNIR